MSTDLIIVLVVLAACLLGVTALCWRMIGGLHGHHALDARVRERERRDYFQMIERLIEGREVPKIQQLDLAHAHRSERIQRVQTDSRIEGEAIKADGKASTVPSRKAKPSPEWDETAKALMGK